MPDNLSDPTDLKSQYAARVAADLENNTKEQERIGADIAALQRQREELERDYALLLTVQQALAADTASGASKVGASAGARLPRARRPGAAGGKRGTPGRRARQGAASGTKGRGTRRRAGEPTLRDIISGLLAAHDEPRSAAEVTTALAESHPERTVSPTVVRNTLEALVAKGQAHRTKQQKSVFYTAAKPADTASAGATTGSTAPSNAPGETSGS